MGTIPRPRIVSRSTDLEADDLPEQVTITVRELAGTVNGIHFQGFRYLDVTLAAYVGEDVTIRYDPRDMAELRVYFGDVFLCGAINPELAGETTDCRSTRSQSGRPRT